HWSPFFLVLLHRETVATPDRWSLRGPRTQRRPGRGMRPGSAGIHAWRAAAQHVNRAPTDSWERLQPRALADRSKGNARALPGAKEDASPTRRRACAAG